MRAFLWYKRKVLFSSKWKMIWLIIIPVIYLLLYSILEIDSNVSMFFFGISIHLIYTYVLFTAGDLSRVNCIIAAGEKPKSIWLANIVFIAATGLIMSFIFQAASAILLTKTFKELMNFYLITLCELPLVVSFLALSTIHFRHNSKNEIIISSIFAVINGLSFFLPMLDLLIDLKLDRYCANIMGIVGMIAIILLNTYMNHSDNETLVMNSDSEISSYDVSLLGLNGEI